MRMGADVIVYYNGDVVGGGRGIPVINSVADVMNKDNNS